MIVLQFEIPTVECERGFGWCGGPVCHCEWCGSPVWEHDKTPDRGRGPFALDSDPWPTKPVEMVNREISYLRWLHSQKQDYGHGNGYCVDRRHDSSEWEKWTDEALLAALRERGYGAEEDK